MSNLKYSELESNRFGLQIFRGNLPVFDINVLTAFYKDNDPDILIFRVPVGEQFKLHALNTLGKDVINADTLVYYEVDLAKAAFNEIKNKDLEFVVAGPQHAGVFASLIEQIFLDYTNHYCSNPLLDRKQIMEGYSEWAISSISIPGNLHILGYLHGQPVGFITCSYDAAGAEIILNGVLPAFQSKGIYTDLVRYVKAHFHALATPSVKVSTQIQNFAVQKAWSREGLVLNSAYVTIHLNKKSL